MGAQATLLDIMKANAADPAVGIIDEAGRAHPEVMMGDARTIPGLNYKTLVRTGVPAVGFRNANEGTATTKGTYENRLVETFILNPEWLADKAVADSYVDGAPAYLAMEGLAMLEGAFQALAKVFYYGNDGTHGDAKGFPGLLQAYDSTNMVVDATGAAADTGSSVWMVRFGLLDVRWVLGNDGEVKLSDPQIVRALDASDNPYPAYWQDILARPGLQIGSIYSIGRIKKLTAEANHTLTDALLGSLLAKFPVGKEPNAIFMTRRSREQLRASRTATNATGAPAPTPIEFQQIPIYATEALKDTEPLTL